MTLSEFKAWFEGFTEDMDARPTEKQWKRIKARVKEIDGTAITKEVWHRYWGPYYTSPVWGFNGSGVGVSSSNTTQTCGANTLVASSGPNQFSTNSLNMYAAGKAEYTDALNS